MLKTLTTSYKECPIKVSRQEYLSITKGFMSFIGNQLLSGKFITLPANVGTLEIVGTKVKPKFDENGKLKGLAPDWVKTKELWNNDPQARANKTKIYHFNEHSNGVRYKYYWSKTGGIANKILYTFVPTRTLKRAMSENVIINKKEYRIKS